MQKEANKKLLFVINPFSGSYRKANWEQVIRDYFDKIPFHPEFYLLNGNNDEATIAQYIKTIQPVKVIAVGGDGTIKMVATIVKCTNTILGVLPAGSANGLAKELKIPGTISQALDVVMNGMVKAIDVVQINDAEICVHLSDLGLNALMIKTFDSLGKRGKWGYAKAVLKVFWKRTTVRVKMETDKQTVRRKAYMVVIANASRYGTGAVINPGSSINDGYFEAVVVRRISLFGLLKMLVSQQTFKSNTIEIFKTKTLHITTKRSSYFQIDGEYQGKVWEIRARILPGVLKIMVPLP